MSIFDSKKVAWRKKIQAAAKSKTQFEELERLYGSPLAKEFVELIHTKAHEQNNAGILDTTPAVSDIIPLLMTVEKNAVLKRRGFYQGYMTDAKSGNLGNQLNADFSPVTDYYKNPGTVGATGRTLAIDQAANWICGTYTAGLPSTRALLGEYIPTNAGAHGKFGPCLGKTSAELWKVQSGWSPACRRRPD